MQKIKLNENLRNLLWNGWIGLSLRSFHLVVIRGLPLYSLGMAVGNTGVPHGAAVR